MKLHKNRGAVQQLIHSNKMTHAASQYEAMKNFMRTEVLMKTVKYRELAGINYTADGVDDSTCQQPEKRTAVKQGHNIGKREYAQPAHGNVQNCRNPFRTVNEEDTLQNAE